MLTKASDNGDLYCSYLLARSYHTGVGLPDNCSIDLKTALELYQKIYSDGSEIGVAPHQELVLYG